MELVVPMPHGGGGVEIASDVARRLLASYREHGDPAPSNLRALGREFEVEVLVTASWAGSLG